MSRKFVNTNKLTGERTEIIANSPEQAKQKFDEWEKAGRPGGKKTLVRDEQGFLDAGASLFKGVTDPIVGGAQLLARAMPTLYQRTMDELVERRETDKAIRNIGKGKVDELELVGELGIAGAATVPFRAAKTILGRMVQGTSWGALFGASQPVNPKSQEYMTQKLIDVGFGAAAGAALTPLMEGLFVGMGSTINLLSKKGKGVLTLMTRKSSSKLIQDEMRKGFKASGVDWEKLPAELKKDIESEIKLALSEGGKFNEQAMERLARYISLNVRPTQGQVTRDPYQFQTEVNRSRVETGEPLRERFLEQNQSLRESVEAVQERNLPTDRRKMAADDLQAGQSTIDELSGMVASKKANIDKAWNTFRDSENRNEALSLKPLSNAFQEVIDNYGVEGLTPVLLRRLNSLGLTDGNIQRQFTVDEADKIIRIINKNFPSMDASQRSASKEIKNAIDESLDNLLGTVRGNVSDDAIVEMRNARALSRDLNELKDKIPALKSVMDEKATPDDFFQKFVLNSKVNDLSELVDNLAPTGQALADIRFRVLEFLKDSATKGEATRFDAGGYRRAFGKITERKLKILFGEKDVQVLMNINKAVRDLKIPPAGSLPNTSGSGTAVIDAMEQMMGRLSRIPYVDRAAKTMSQRVKEEQARSSLTGVPVDEMQPLINLERGMFDRRGRIPSTVRTIGIPLSSPIEQGVSGMFAP